MILDIGDLIIFSKNNAPLMVVNRFPVERFEYKEGTSNKFWEIFRNGTKEYTTRWGRIGTEGQSTTKTWSDESENTKEYNKIIKEKKDKGYTGVPNKEAFMYVFSDPSRPGKTPWISYIDLNDYLKQESATVQKKK